MSYHILSNDGTTVELMPFATLEEENDYAEDYAYRQSSSSLFGMIPQWNDSDIANGAFSGPLGEVRFQMWNKWQHVQHVIQSRWQLMSKRRQKRFLVVFVVLGVFVIVLSIEHGVKTIHEKHVKPPIHKDWINDDDSESLDDTGDSDTMEYDIPVNRGLCERILPLFQMLDESLDQYCFQRNTLACANSRGTYALYERDDVLFTPDGSLVDHSPVLVDHCRRTGPDIWSPLSPLDGNFDKVCQRCSMDNDAKVAANRFCAPSSYDENQFIVDWVKVKEMVPKCLATTDCNDLDSKIFQEVTGGHLNCWEFEIAYKYIVENAGSIVDADDNFCKGGLDDPDK